MDIDPNASAKALSAKASAASERSEPERRRPGNSLSIGAPLTAAFIGGFLVIENLFGAEALEGGDSPALADDSLLVDGDDPDGEGSSLPNAGTEGDSAVTADGSGHAADPAAAPVEDVAFQTGGSGGVSGSAGAAVAAASITTSMPEDAEGGGSGANINLFNIDIDTIGDEGEAASDFESEVISRNRQFGTPGDDVLTGTDGHDAISGGEGDDLIEGLGGSDILNGNGGDDQLFGGAGQDRLDGGFGNDLLDGGDDGELDLLKGGGGDDVLIVNGRSDIALESYGDSHNGGDDLLLVRDSFANDLPEGADGFTFDYAENFGTDLPDGAAAARRLVGNNIEHVTLEGSANHDIVADSFDNRLTGNDGDNLIRAGGGDDILAGGAGRDDLLGGEGDDRIDGGAGNDVIAGGLGRDELFGDGGDDVFVIGLNDSAIDTVFDHEGANRLKIDGVTDQTVEASILGDDLYVTVDEVPVAMVADYVGHEDAIAGVDFGQGLRTVDTLLVDRPDLAGAVDQAEQRSAEAASDDLLAAHLHLGEPTITGAPRMDERLDGTEADDWLSGFDGKDILYGHDGDDILEGGDGADRLRGGAGDDRYLFSRGESGIDKIEDAEGRNLAELEGYDSAEIEGAMLGDDLAVLADGKVLFTVDDFAVNPTNFEGVQVGNRFVQTDDLLA